MILVDRHRENDQFDSMLPADSVKTKARETDSIISSGEMELDIQDAKIDTGILILKLPKTPYIYHLVHTYGYIQRIRDICDMDELEKEYRAKRTPSEKKAIRRAKVEIESCVISSALWSEYSMEKLTKCLLKEKLFCWTDAEAANVSSDIVKRVENSRTQNGAW
ncbi:hypothetical protein BHYA_0034g00140 [Botrytis hyacinthi]|uniref:Uncharacterized protein n=1 Tax=Botrytis hyacinthi TaxID=278943 RepID=A0A4Z1GV26_9HELO|nr:hypothetical protein BHYA_0034g00140 [Botrytis hyacinthi]